MFQHKNYVMAISQAGSFTKAAEKLFISQPSLSAIVKRLEEKIGAPLFDRSSTPVRLTEIGAEYVKCAGDIAEAERNFEAFCADHTKNPSGLIRVGGSSFFSSFILPAALSSFQGKYPHARVEMYEDSTKNLLKKLADGSLDIVVDNAVIRDESVVSRPFAEEKILLAVPSRFVTDNRLQSMSLTATDVKKGKHYATQGVNLSFFDGVPFVLLHPENDTGKRAETLLKKYAVAPTVVYHLDQQITAYNVTCTGMGASFVSETLVKHIGTDVGVCYFAIADRLATRSLFFYHKKNRYLPLTCKAFFEESTTK